LRAPFCGEANYSKGQRKPPANFAITCSLR
jgi:hypothetical protein